jgi:hypothetical protein
MQHVFLRSGIEIKFDLERCEFSFNEKGYFEGDVSVKTSSMSGFTNVQKFTFHLDEISCHWIKKL